MITYAQSCQGECSDPVAKNRASKAHQSINTPFVHLFKPILDFNDQSQFPTLESSRKNAGMSRRMKSQSTVPLLTLNSSSQKPEKKVPKKSNKIVIDLTLLSRKPTQKSQNHLASEFQAPFHLCRSQPRMVTTTTLNSFDPTIKSVSLPPTTQSAHFENLLHGLTHFRNEQLIDIFSQRIVIVPRGPDSQSLTVKIRPPVATESGPIQSQLEEDYVLKLAKMLTDMPQLIHSINHRISNQQMRFIKHAFERHPFTEVSKPEGLFARIKEFAQNILTKIGYRSTDDQAKQACKEVLTIIKDKAPQPVTRLTRVKHLFAWMLMMRPYPEKIQLSAQKLVAKVKVN